MKRRDALQRIAAVPFVAASSPLVVASLLGAPAAAAATPDQFSEAEKRLFVDDQLGNLPARAAMLEYSFTKRGSLEPAVDDRAVMQVGAPEKSGGRSVHVDFLSNAQHVQLPDVNDATGNPIILFFLERDVREMHRLTGGSISYYRKLIRMALAEGAQVQPVTAAVDAGPISATEIRIEPYRDDPARPRYERFANKRYRFTLAHDVPGKVVEMRSDMFAPTAGDPPAGALIAEVLRFARMR
ncbi:MAG TPA: hypothetical protein VLI21_05760 [Casimicrobiaceae bacterium]|nr:hypothetical protein [Casimicrobiaceae bacterium]